MVENLLQDDLGQFRSLNGLKSAESSYDNP